MKYYCSRVNCGFYTLGSSLQHADPVIDSSNIHSLAPLCPAHTDDYKIWKNDITDIQGEKIWSYSCVIESIWRSERSKCSHSQKSRFAIDICLVCANHTEHARKRSSPWR